MVMLVSPVQLLNAFSPIEVTELGMSMPNRPLQSENANAPILVTVLGMMVFLQPNLSELVEVQMRALQLSRES